MFHDPHLRPVRIVALGGSISSGSATEMALICCLKRADALGAETRLFGGEFLAMLPTFDPRPCDPTPAQMELVEAIRNADGVIVGSPAYHGSISGAVKNALDTLELTARDDPPYFHGKAVGAVVTAYGWQATGSTLAALRAIIHAMRGWPTPFGAALNSAAGLFDEAGGCRDAKDAWALSTVAEQVMEFAKIRAETA